MNDTKEVKIVKRWLENNSISVERITQNMYPDRQIPDFKLTDSHNNVYFSEIKSPDLLLDNITGLFKHVTTVSKLRDLMHTASKQFASVNPEHRYPNILLWTSYNFQLNWTNLADSIQGGVFRYGQIINDMRKDKFIVRTQKDMVYVDGHVWLQINKDAEKVYEVSVFIRKDASQVLRSLLGTLESNHYFFILSHLSHFILESR